MKDDRFIDEALTGSQGRFARSIQLMDHIEEFCKIVKNPR